jgi:hypothetical protein
VPEKSHPREAIVVDRIIIHRLMTIKEVQAWLGLSEKNLRMMVSRSRRGKGTNPIPFYQLGGKSGQLRFDYDEILKWARGGSENPVR